MKQPECDIWFGPGGLTGIFGAGVAAELQNALQRGEIDPSKLRLFGSSVGCLTAAYVATGNAHNGVSVFQETVENLIKRSNLFPSLTARFANQVVGTVWDSKRVFPVPSVVNLDHALAVMTRRTPNIVRELRAAEIPTFAECVHVRTGEFQHVELQSAQHPLAVIRDALTCFPFAWEPNNQLLDSGISGYGFVNLIRHSHRKLIVVLNSGLAPRLRESLAGIACAVLAANAPISRLYMCRQRDRRSAIRSAQQCGDRALVIAPEQPLRLKHAADFQRAYDAGRDAARGVIHFAQEPNVPRGVAEQPARGV